MEWYTPDVPNGGRSPKMLTTQTGRKADGSKAQVALSNQIKMFETDGRTDGRSEVR